MNDDTAFYDDDDFSIDPNFFDESPTGTDSPTYAFITNKEPSDANNAAIASTIASTHTSRGRKSKFSTTKILYHTMPENVNWKMIQKQKL